MIKIIVKTNKSIGRRLTKLSEKILKLFFINVGFIKNITMYIEVIVRKNLIPHGIFFYFFSLK